MKFGKKHGVLLGVGSLVVATGVWTGIRVTHDDFRPLCDGAVEKQALQEGLGREKVKAAKFDDLDSISSVGRLAECSAWASDSSATMTVNIGTQKAAPRILAQAVHDDLDSRVVSGPVGSRWPGVYTMENPTHASVTVALGCRAKRPSRLLVNVQEQLTQRETSFQDSSERTHLARAAAIVSRKASTIWKCGADRPPKIRSVETSPRLKTPKPVNRAAGTCHALRKLASVAKQHGITQASGAASSSEAPSEDCLLFDAKGKERYRLSALHDTFARGFRESGDANPEISGTSGKRGQGSADWPWAWASAACPGNVSRSLFAVTSSPKLDNDGKPLKGGRAFEKSVLAAFATESAEQHDCGQPELPH